MTHQVSQCTYCELPFADGDAVVAVTGATYDVASGGPFMDDNEWLAVYHEGELGGDRDVPAALYCYEAVVKLAEKAQADDRKADVVQAHNQQAFDSAPHQTDLVASGYEAECPRCNAHNRIIEVPGALDLVVCVGCETPFATGLPEHAYG